MKMSLRISVPRPMSAGVKRQRTTPDGTIVLGKLLGSGSQGHVHIGKVVHTRQRVAVKVVARRSRHGCNEVAAMTRLPPHRHIVAIPTGCAIHTSASHVYMPLELANTDMLEALLAHGRFSECDARRYFVHLLDGLTHCHTHGVYHLDIKPENVLLIDGRAVLADFGSALISDATPAKADYPSGSVSNAAPEVVPSHLQPYDAAAADVWSLGVLLFVMVTGRPPWTAPGRKDRNFARLLDGTFEWPADVHKDLRHLLQSMLTVTPADRPSLSQLRAHPWVSPSSYPTQRLHRRTSSTPEASLGSRLASLHICLSADNSDHARLAHAAAMPLAPLPASSTSTSTTITLSCTPPTASSSTLSIVAPQAAAHIAAPTPFCTATTRTCSTLSGGDAVATPMTAGAEGEPSVELTPRPVIKVVRARRRVPPSALATMLSPRKVAVKRRSRADTPPRMTRVPRPEAFPLASPVGKRSTSFFLSTATADHRHATAGSASPMHKRRRRRTVPAL